MAVYLRNNLENGTNGTTVSTANSGGTGNTAFNVVTIGSGGTLTFSSTEAAHGFLSAKLVEPASVVNVSLAWSTSLTATSIPTVYFRAYVWLSALPTAGVRLFSILNGSTFIGGVQLNTTGKLSALNAAGTSQTFPGNGITSTTNAINVGSWSRIEGFITGSATVGQVSVSIFNSMDSVTATETQATAATLNTSSAITQIRFGDPSSVASFTIYLDDLGASDTGYLGPAQIIGSGSVTLPKMKLSAAATELLALSGGVILPKMRLSASVREVLTVSCGVTLPKMRLSAQASEVLDISGSVTLPKMQLSASAAEVDPLSGGAILPKMRVSGTLEPIVTLSAAVAFPKMRIAAEGAVVSTQPILSGGVILPKMQIFGTYYRAVEEDSPVTAVLWHNTDVTAVLWRADDYLTMTDETPAIEAVRGS